MLSRLRGVFNECSRKVEPGGKAFLLESNVAAQLNVQGATCGVRAVVHLFEERNDVADLRHVSADVNQVGWTRLCSIV